MIIVTVPYREPQDEGNLTVWYHIKSCDEKGDRVVGILHAETPDVTGFTQVRAAQVEEETNLNLGGTPALAYFKQAEGQSIGAGDAWILVSYR